MYEDGFNFIYDFHTELFTCRALPAGDKALFRELELSDCVEVSSYVA